MLFVPNRHADTLETWQLYGINSFSETYGKQQILNPDSDVREEVKKEIQERKKERNRPLEYKTYRNSLIYFNLLMFFFYLTSQANKKHF